jgi:hypothetical protein
LLLFSARSSNSGERCSSSSRILPLSCPSSPALLPPLSPFLFHFLPHSLPAQAGSFPITQMDPQFLTAQWEWDTDMVRPARGQRRLSLTLQPASSGPILEVEVSKLHRHRRRIPPLTHSSCRGGGNHRRSLSSTLRKHGAVHSMRSLLRAVLLLHLLSSSHQQVTPAILGFFCK